MEKTVSKLPDPEVPEEELNDVSGGFYYPGWSPNSKHCPKCDSPVPYNWVGLCSACQQKEAYHTR